MVSQNNIIGTLGESIACRFLSNKGFSIVKKNYRKKWGEIDIIAKKDSIIHFVEVKSVSRAHGYGGINNANDEFMPEENIHPEKIRRLLRTINSYISEKHLHNKDIEWQLDALVVVLDQNEKKAHVRVVENITT
ncbi:MAG: YraN family protein [bacterium]|nr:YraN family protein [bacterium]